MTTPLESIINIDALTEDDAHTVFFALCKRFDWVGTYFSPEDIKNTWQDRTGQAPTTEQVLQVMGSRAWVKYLSEAISTEGMAAIDEMVYETIRDMELEVN
jgi:hypothetical protein